MTNKPLFIKISSVEKLATASKFNRMLHNPYKYFLAILYRKLIYKKTKREKEVTSKTFFDADMYLLIPSSTDIYLTGGKSHDSEIRLAKFLINHLHNGDTFLDVGAHYGYFSMLASELVADTGHVIALEASKSTYSTLAKNSKSYGNIASFNLAASDTNTYLTFYEFPNLYSEYNSLDITQYKNEAWFQKNKPLEIKIESVILDNFISEKNLNPKIIKIDVEGAEFKVLTGLKNYLTNFAPIVIMEFLSESRGNTEHVKAEKFLFALGYRTNIINNNGELNEVESMSNYMKKGDIDSENVVFMKD